LAELGARVIKIEQPGVGDYYRAGGEKTLIGGRQVHALNQGKESLGLDLKTDEGREIFKKLVRKSDVVLESFRPGTLQRLKIAYPALKKINPRIILCSITGGGQKGKGAMLAGHDLNYLGSSGLLLKIKDSEGRPVSPGFQIVDLATGQEAAMRIVAALYQNQKNKKTNKKGEWIDCSMAGSALSLARLYPPREKTFSKIRYAIYRTSDGGFMTFAPLEAKFWDRFCQITGRSDWSENSLRELFLSKSKEEWTSLGEKEDICLFPVEELSPEFFEGKNFADLGYHTGSILKTLGYRPDRIKELKKKGVVA
jgi:crotonobetainyl-CoA:carnitine CoA-transferase CaiB-like acyl-CoA transferase